MNREITVSLHMLKWLSAILAALLLGACPTPNDKVVTDTENPTGSKGSEWASKTFQWSGRSAHTSVVFQDKVWVLGGTNGSAYYNDVWSSADGNGKEWKQEEANAEWFPRNFHTSVVFKGKIWVLGGKDDSDDYRDDVWSSADGKKWDRITSGTDTPWSARYKHTSVVFNNKIWVLGGTNGSAYYNDVWSSADGKKWEQVTSAKTGAAWPARYKHTSVVFKDKIWVLGGKDGNGASQNDVWSSADGKKWKREVANAEWSPRSNHTSVVFKDKIWVLGGKDHSDFSKNDVWHSADGKKWDRITSGTDTPWSARSKRWSARYKHTSVVFNNKIWVLGGYDGTYKNDVWSGGY